MRSWKNWLFPILTCLTVAALALLPLRLSVLEDGKLTGTVHAEELPADSNFPSKPPDLPGRIWLLVQMLEMPEDLTIMSQELEGEDRNREMERLRKALEELGTLLPPETAALLREAGGNSWDWSRCYLRDQTDLSSASFTMAQTYDKFLESVLSVTLDGADGQILSLYFSSVDTMEPGRSPRELGEALLDRLGLSYELAQDGSQEDGAYGFATFRLPECKSWFTVNQLRRELDFSFTLDWSAVEAETAEMYGYPSSASGRFDASSMEKW